MDRLIQVFLAESGPVLMSPRPLDQPVPSWEAVATLTLFTFLWIVLVTALAFYEQDPHRRGE